MTIPTAAEPAVPVTGERIELEPNEAMLIAARDWSQGYIGTPIGNDAARGVWRAMATAFNATAAPPAPADIVALVKAALDDGFACGAHTSEDNESHATVFDRAVASHEALLAAIGRMGRGAALEGWRPIKSAACVEGAVLLGWGQYREMDGEQPAFMRWYDGVYRGWYISGMEFFPTHWKPLPSAPGAAPPPPPAGEPVEPSPDVVREALEPFAAAADNLDDDHADQSSIWETSAAMSIDARDLRRARKALASAQPRPEVAGERDASSYAIEHAEYMAKGAERLLAAINTAVEAEEAGEKWNGTADAFMVAREIVNDECSSLKLLVYEFRKRARASAGRSA